jgi:DNA-binding beta-propeller fold protein YncE
MRTLIRTTAPALLLFLGTTAFCAPTPVACEPGDSFCDPRTYLLLIQQKDRDPAVDKIIWIDNANEIRLSEPDGSKVSVIVAGLSNTGLMRVDNVNRKVYWSEVSPNNRIGVVDLDRLTVTYLNLTHSPRGLWLDVEARFIYYSDNTNNLVGRVGLDGSGQTTLISGLTSPLGIARHPDSGYFYVCDPGIGIRVFDPNLTEVSTLLTGFTNPGDVRIDTLEDRLYVAFAGGGQEHISSDLSGQDVIQLAAGFNTGSMAINSRASEVYIMDQTSNTLFVTDLAGQAGRDLLVSPDVTLGVSPDLLYEESN